MIQAESSPVPVLGYDPTGESMSLKVSTKGRANTQKGHDPHGNPGPRAPPAKLT